MCRIVRYVRQINGVCVLGSPHSREGWPPRSAGRGGFDPSTATTVGPVSNLIQRRTPASCQAVGTRPWLLRSLSPPSKGGESEASLDLPCLYLSHPNRDRTPSGGLFEDTLIDEGFTPLPLSGGLLAPTLTDNCLPRYPTRLRSFGGPLSWPADAESICLYDGSYLLIFGFGTREPNDHMAEEVLVIASSAQVSLDDVDVAIVRLLQADGRTSNAEIARRIGLSAPATHARVKRLEESGVIRGYTAVLDRETAGFDMVCFINVSLQLHQFEAVERFKELVQEMPEVLECHHITGEFDYLLKAVFRNRGELQQFVVNRLTPIPGMAQINTSVVLIEIKANTPLPID